jgi:outer membrane protein OmpA-like peptidoglycan-associated protein
MKTPISALLLGCGLLQAQPQAPAANVFHVSVTSRTIKAVNYRHRSGSTKIDFKGTDLLPLSHGEARVESKQGYLEVDVEFRDLQPASKYGIEYLTYVMWAVSPEGRTANLGEVLLNGTNSKLHVTTDLQVFGLIVTAEPYYAVTQPSDLIVMENMVRTDTVGKVEEIEAKYELLQRGQYEKLSNPLALKADKRLPLELYEARNAVSIARSIGAGQVAPESFAKAEKSLAQAEAYQNRNAGRKPVAMMAREAVQMAEDARTITTKRQVDAAMLADRQQSADREMRAESGRAAAESETDRVKRNALMDEARLKAEKEAQANASLAEADRVRRDNDARAAAAKTESDMKLGAAQTEADRLRRESDARALAAGSEADRLKSENDARAAAAKEASDTRLAAAGSEADRLKLENDARTTAAKADSDSRLATADAEADRLKRENASERAASRIELDKVAAQKAQMEKERTELRAQLLNQFNLILQTRDTTRGLIVNMSDVLFDTAKFSLRPLAREKLAKVAGIVAGHPGLRLDVEGYTDSVGGDDYNQLLSEHRGESVRDYLTAQGMASASVTTKGFGKSQPVASNDTAEGRQQNRRVELVISGEIIGTEIGRTVAVR